MRATTSIDVSEALLVSPRVHEGLNLFSISNQQPMIDTAATIAAFPELKCSRLLALSGDTGELCLLIRARAGCSNVRLALGSLQPAPMRALLHTGIAFALRCRASSVASPTPEDGGSAKSLSDFQSSLAGVERFANYLHRTHEFR